MLSLPTIHALTKAQTVLLYRHPGAALTSYRRMGWQPDVAELRPIVDSFLASTGPVLGVRPFESADTTDEVAAMAWFWNSLYGIALHDASQLPNCVILAHEDVAMGGTEFCRDLFDVLDLSWSDEVAHQLNNQGSAGTHMEATALHNFDRAPSQVAQQWRSKLSSDESARIEAETEEVLRALASRSFPQSPK